jgi:glucose uptake protein GlcU
VPKFIVVNDKTDLCYGDVANEKLIPLPNEQVAEIGINPRDPNNVAYTKYNKEFTRFQGISGVGVLIPQSIPCTLNDIITYFFDNMSFTPPKQHKIIQTVAGYPAGMIYITRAVLTNLLGPGFIESYGTVLVKATNTVYILKQRDFIIKLP